MELLLGLLLGVVGTEAYNNMPGQIKAGDLVRKAGYSTTERVVVILPSGIVETMSALRDGTIVYWTHDNADRLVCLSCGDN